MTDAQKLVKLAWVGWEADDANGYATISKRYRQGFAPMPEISFVNNYGFDWDAIIALCTPVGWVVGRNRQPRPDLVFHTMFEAEPLPRGWVENMNCAGLIWTPSEYCVDLFKRSGVTTDIVKIGYGIDHHTYQYYDRHGRKEPMKFLIWADTLTSRKNVFLAAKAFLAANLPNASLEIKVHSFLGGNALSMFVDSRGQPRANISLHQGSWSREKLVGWLESGDCLIYASGGEGFGQMPLEAMATGLPVVCAANTGMMEYLSDDVALLVPTDGRVRADSLSLAFGVDITMCNPSFDAMVERIRWVYENRELAYAMGDRAHAATQKWTWEGAARQAADVLLERYGH